MRRAFGVSVRSVLATLLSIERLRTFLTNRLLLPLLYVYYVSQKLYVVHENTRRRETAR